MKLKKELLAAMAAAGVFAMTPVWAAQQQQAEQPLDEEVAEANEVQADERAAADEAAEDQAAVTREEEDQAWFEDEEEDPFAAEDDPMAAEDDPMADNAAAGDPELAEMDPPVSDDLITALQEQLNQEGHDLAVDGIWGPETQAALQDYQQQQGLDDSGQLDAQTLAELQLDQQDDVAQAEEEDDVSLFEPADEQEQQQ